MSQKKLAIICFCLLTVTGKLDEIYFYLNTGHTMKLAESLNSIVRALIFQAFPIYLIDLPLVNFRIHFAQTTMVNDRDNVDEFEVYKDFLNKNFRNFLHPKTIFIIDEKPKYWFQQKLENVVFKIKNLLK